MTASQFIAALQAGVNALANAANAPQFTSANNPTPAPVTANQAKALALSPQGQTASKQKSGDLISQLFSWLIPSGWTPARI
jgi:neutral trehalase